MLAEILSFVKGHIALVVAAILVGHLLHNKYQKGLDRYPGPTLASFTNIWRFFLVWNGKPEQTHIALHRELGDVVRLGPNVLSFGTAAALKDIYGLNKGFVKVQQHPHRSWVNSC